MHREVNVLSSIHHSVTNAFPLVCVAQNTSGMPELLNSGKLLYEINIMKNRVVLIDVKLFMFRSRVPCFEELN